MSAESAVANFLGVGTLVRNIYSAYTRAPEPFRSFSQEILSLHAVYKRVADQLRNQGFGNGALTLSANSADDLGTLYDGLQTIMVELDALLKKYRGLAENHGWGQEDLRGLRERILVHVGLLTAFNTSLTCVQAQEQNAPLEQQSISLKQPSASSIQPSAQPVAIPEQLKHLFTRVGFRRNESVASLSSVVPFPQALAQSQEPESKELCTEFHDNCANPEFEMVKGKKQDTIKLLRTATGMSSSGDIDGEAFQMSQGDHSANDADTRAVQKVQAPWQFKNLLQTLSVSATRAPYYAFATLSSLVSDYNALYLAAIWGNLSEVERLLDEGASIIDATKDTQWTALHVAAVNGNSDLVKLLLNRGASIDAIDFINRTALHLAALQGHTEIVNILLDKGAHADATCKSMFDTDLTALHLAAQYGHAETVNALLGKGASIEAMCKFFSNTYGTALHQAAQYGHPEVINALLDRGASIDARDYSHQTAFLRAARCGNTEAVSVLLDRGASIDARNDSHWNALHLAAECRQTQVVDVLLERGVWIDAKDNQNRTALHIAAELNYTEFVSVLVEKGANLFAIDNKGRTALHLAAQYGYPKVVKALLEKGSSIDATDDAGWTALHHAAGTEITPWSTDLQSQVETVKVLLSKGANTELKTHDGKTATELAQDKCWEPIVRVLAPRGYWNMVTSALQLGQKKA